MVCLAMLQTNQINHKTVTITTYAMKYHGRRTANGEVYSKHKLSVAVPLIRKNGRSKPVIPFGSTIRLSYKGRSVDVRVNDVCPAGTYDLSSAAMTRLLGRYIPTKFKGKMTILRT